MPGELAIHLAPLEDTLSAANGFSIGDSPESTVSLGGMEAAQHDAEISDWIYGHFVSRSSNEANDSCDPSIAQAFFHADFSGDRNLDEQRPGFPVNDNGAGNAGVGFYLTVDPRSTVENGISSNEYKS